jgi:hypothetical protein
VDPVAPLPLDLGKARGNPWMQGAAIKKERFLMDDEWY